MRKIIILMMALFLLAGCQYVNVDAKSVSESPVSESEVVSENETEKKNEQIKDNPINFKETSYTLEGMDTVKTIGELPFTPDMINIMGDKVGFLYHYCLDGLKDEDYKADVKRDNEGSMYLYYATLEATDIANVYTSANGETIPSWEPLLAPFGDSPQFFFKIEDDYMLVSTTETFEDYDKYTIFEGYYTVPENPEA